MRKAVGALAFAAALAIGASGHALAASAAPAGASSCSGCHAHAEGVDTPVPRLAGRNAEEMTAQMEAFRSGKQASTVMDRIVKGFSESELRAIAQWYAQQKP